MTWLTPALAGIAAAVAVPALLILYFLKLRRREVEISSTFLWKQSIRDLQANAPFQRLRNNILLILQMLALLAALTALAQPLWRTNAPPGGRSVMLIDRSASMSTLDETDESGKPVSRLDLAKRDALAFVDALSDGSLFGHRPSDEAMIITFDAVAQVVQPFTTNKQRLREAIKAITPTDAPTNLDEAMKLAGAYTRRIDEGGGANVGAGPPVFLWSDGNFSDSRSVNIPPEVRVEYRAVGNPDTPNLAITSIRARRAYDRAGEASIFVAIQSTDPASRTVDVQLAIDGIVAAVRSVTIPGASPEGEPATAGVVFRLDRSEGAILSARLLSTDALASDDQARIVLTPARRLAVGVVTRGNLFLRTALEGPTLSRVDLLTPEKFESLVAEGKNDQYDVFVLDNWAPSGPLPPGGYLIFNALPAIGNLSTRPNADPIEVSVAIDWDRAHPALQHVSLENLVIGAPMLIQQGDGYTTLATGPHGPVILEVAEGAARAIVLGFDIARSNWPFDVGFVVFMAYAIRHLGEEPAALAADIIIPGGALTTRLPAGTSLVTVTLPDGSTANAMAGPDGRVSYGPIARAGIYTLAWDGPPGPRDPIIDGRPRRALPVNLLDSFESRVGARQTLDLPAGAITAAAAGLTSRNEELWMWLLLGVLVILMLEWWMYHRRVRL